MENPSGMYFAGVLTQLKNPADFGSVARNQRDFIKAKFLLRPYCCAAAGIYALWAPIDFPVHK